MDGFFYFTGGIEFVIAPAGVVIVEGIEEGFFGFEQVGIEFFEEGLLLLEGGLFEEVDVVDKVPLLHPLIEGIELGGEVIPIEGERFALSIGYGAMQVFHQRHAV